MTSQYLISNRALYGQVTLWERKKKKIQRHSLCFNNIYGIRNHNIDSRMTLLKYETFQADPMTQREKVSLLLDADRHEELSSPLAFHYSWQESTSRSCKKQVTFRDHSDISNPKVSPKWWWCHASLSSVARMVWVNVKENAPVFVDVTFIRRVSWIIVDFGEVK